MKKKTWNFGDSLIEIYGWIRILASPLLIGIAIGLGIYLSSSTTGGLIAAIFVVTLGLVIGIIWATRVKKKNGAMNFISKVRESPDLDYLDEDNEKTSAPKVKT